MPILSRPFKCNVCYSTSFADVSELNQHNEYFHPKPFKCDICFDTSFLKLDDLNLHIERFHPKKLQCQLCSEASFSEYSHLKQHIQGIKCWNCGRFWNLFFSCFLFTLFLQFDFSETCFFLNHWNLFFLFYFFWKTKPVSSLFFFVKIKKMYVSTHIYFIF